ncbi:addiction module protein [Luteolibacter sp. Populi]|uniref:addiction module protein n=1 Tax=Luteolibacter sp. Populi TaxID=3230487 RepID=UPI003466F24A
MVSVSEIEAQAMNLPDAERAILAARLLESLPAMLSDDDQGIGEAMRRDAEMDLDPSKGMTLDELRSSLGR